MIPVYPYSILKIKKTKIPREIPFDHGLSSHVLCGILSGKLQCCAMKGEESQSSWKGVKGTGCKLNWWRCLVALISWMLWILLHSWQQWPLSNKSTGPREMSRFHVPKWWIMMSPAWSQPQFLAIYSELSWAHPKWWHKGIPLNRTLILVQKPR